VAPTWKTRASRIYLRFGWSPTSMLILRHHLRPPPTTSYSFNANFMDPSMGRRSFSPPPPSLSFLRLSKRTRLLMAYVRLGLPPSFKISSRVAYFPPKFGPPQLYCHDPTAKRATLMARDVPSADLERRSYAFSPTRSIACAGALDPFDSSFEKTRVYPSGLSRPSEREKYKEKRRGTGAKRAPFNRGFFF
jgi:hypothetical protein